MKNQFTSASLKLTAWYLLLLMLISLLFSVILYSISVTELRRSLRDEGPNRPLFELFVDSDIARQIRETRYRESRDHLLGNLIALNIATLVAGGGLSYLLARKTLRPIEVAVEAQSRFTSDASHELRTPLAVMRSEIEIGLRNKSAKKSDYAALLASNLEEVDRLRELSDRLLLLSSERELTLEPVSLEDVAIDATSHVVKLAQQRQIAVTNEVGPISVKANREALADAIGILLDNAIKYSPKNTTVTLGSERSGRFAHLSVKDEGPGVAAEHMPHLFDRFYRIDESRSKQNVEGHGLGLSIAQRIVQQHNGRITVDSEPGKGATFTIHVPLV